MSSQRSVFLRCALLCTVFAWSTITEKWMVGQAMDNRVMLFQIVDEKLRFAKKKAFKGHTVAGYACTVDFSPDMS